MIDKQHNLLPVIKAERVSWYEYLKIRSRCYRKDASSLQRIQSFTQKTLNLTSDPEACITHFTLEVKCVFL